MLPPLGTHPKGWLETVSVRARVLSSYGTIFFSLRLYSCNTVHLKIDFCFVFISRKCSQLILPRGQGQKFKCRCILPFICLFTPEVVKWFCLFCKESPVSPSIVGGAVSERSTVILCSSVGDASFWFCLLWRLFSLFLIFCTLKSVCLGVVFAGIYSA